MSELEHAIEHDQKHGKWYAYGRAVLGGTDFIHPVEIADNGNVICRTGSSQKPVAPDEYLRVHREFAAFRKVGIWDFTPYDDPAANDVRQAHACPNSAGRRLHDLRSECEQLRDRLAQAEALLRELSAYFDNYADVVDSDRGVAEVPNESMEWLSRISVFLSDGGE